MIVYLFWNIYKIKKPIVKSNRFSQIKATYYNPIRKNTIKIIVKDSYKLIPMPLRDFGK